MTIILDASVLCAFANTRDVHHKTAVALLAPILAGHFGQPIITDHIFDEVVGVITRKVGREEAMHFGTTLLASEVELHYADHRVFQHAWALFKKHKTFSFTDCTIVAFMQSLGIKNIATFDKAFTQVKSITVVEHTLS